MSILYCEHKQAMTAVHTLGVGAGVWSSDFVFSGELSDKVLTDDTDNMDRFPRLEIFPDSFCSSGSLSEGFVVSSCEIVDRVSSFSSNSFASSLLTVVDSLPGSSEEVVFPLLGCLSFDRQQVEEGLSETRAFTGDNDLSSVRSMMFSSETVRGL